MAHSHEVRVRRAYEEPGPGDGARVLVDRIWPRGVSKDRAGLDEWCKSIAPSTELRKWYAHDPARFEEFARRYRAELDEPERAAALEHLRDLAERGPLTLITATKHVDISEATVLTTLLQVQTRNHRP
ncbi:uncharacterized protein YeaO (DUF488 family) [Georgenia soli]|uniref:Uncharacterized protein YeaO (DUF488 family) n=1 Tax=Georgenia soli TaxID=638953 RepID=A0A2A9F378_9MICO|nr:DUF488 family protein [Georgenia soli]PFG44905.1 uncharacterized protein YeaO (DUF488 family) [Georgenia soli]